MAMWNWMDIRGFAQKENASSTTFQHVLEKTVNYEYCPDIQKWLDIFQKRCLQKTAGHPLSTFMH